jgi:hypothetical protein
LKYFAESASARTAVEIVRRKIVDQVREASLMIDQQDGAIGFIETVVFERAHDGCVFG